VLHDRFIKVYCIIATIIGWGFNVLNVILRVIITILVCICLLKVTL
jgi:hypothetical protein